MAEVTDIVERVARAIFGQLGQGSGDYDDAARAALAAMLEAVGEPVAWRWHNPKFGEHIETEPLTENYRDYPGWTETPLYSLAALKEEL